MDYHDRSLDGQKADNNIDSGRQDHKISKMSKDSINNYFICLTF